MKLNFLCTHHRCWLEQNPTAALSTCLDSYERGLDLMEDNDFRGAANHAGCALEAAQILLDSDGGEKGAVINHYSDAGVLLIYGLMQLGQYKLAANVHGCVLSQLENMLVTRGPHGDALSACQRWLRLSEEIGLYPDLAAGDSVQRLAVSLH